ncbi:MAG TPA: hypothetical protein ENN13_00230, partial [Candidatus Altiarchaeales archaeon]|nr:hypothetical protein [Candidatus Altiarchaeales archaeon]
MEKHECGPEKHECGLEIKPYTLITVIALFATISLTYLSLSGFPPQEYPLLNLSLKVHTTFWERLISLAAMILTFWGLGYSFTYRLEKNEDSLSSSLLNVCIGLGVFPVLSLILNTPLLGIPLDIRVFLPLSLLVPAYSLVKAFTSEGVELKAPKLLFTKDLAYTSIVLFMASLTLYVFVAGSFAYPWLEDGDSWRHADGVKYIAVQKTYVLPEGVPVTETLEPYPPTYDGYMALGHQLNSSLQWSMKYFTSLLASLGIIGFYYFAKKFTGSMDVALASTFFLAATPSYVSHFIWSYTLGYILFFPALYSIEKCVKDRGWIMPAVFQTASLMVIQALIAPTFGVIMVIYLAVRSLMDRKLAKNVLIAGVLGLLISLWIFWIPMYQNYWGSGAKLNSIDVALSKGVFKMDHEATTYPLSEFIFVKPYGNIAIHKGFGLVLFPLFILSTLLM